jgi:rhamnosyltransferase
MTAETYHLPANGIAAVVVTFNGESEVGNTIRAVAHQVDYTVVVDNGSTDDTVRVISDLIATGLAVSLVELGTNLGIGAALNAGFREAVRHEARWVLTLDQDSTCVEDMVAALVATYLSLERASQRPGLVAAHSLPVHAPAPASGRDSRPMWEVPWIHTSGNLVPTATWSEAGGYNEAYFIDMVDYEFCLRVRRAGLSIWVTADAVLHHRPGSVTRASVLGRSVALTNYSPARRYYQARNSVILARDARDRAFAASRVDAFVRELTKVMAFEDGRRQKATMMIRGLVDGARGRTGPVQTSPGTIGRTTTNPRGTQTWLAAARHEGATVSQTPRATSIVLNWRQPDLTVSCVRQLLTSDYPNHHVVVVDNGSEDGSLGQLTAQLPEATVIGSHTNRGFSAGCNLGLRHALEEGSEIVGLVNNDLVLERGAVSAAVAALQENPQYGCVTGKIYAGEPNVIWQAGGHVDHFRIMGIARGLGEHDHGQFDVPGTTEWASGAMCMFRSSVLEEIGLLPEEYFFGQEEWDFSTSIIRHGHEIGYVPTYVGTHRSCSSYKTNPALNSYGAVRNRHLYAEKYLRPWQYQLWRAAFYAHLRLVMARKLRSRGTHDQIPVHVRGMLLGWHRHRKGDPVTLDELNAVSAELGIPTSWAPGEPR